MKRVGWILNLCICTIGVNILIASSVDDGDAIALPVESDRSLPISTQVNRTNSQTFAITGGTIKGQNLFHSFHQFSVPTQQTASFRQISPTVKNVFARITGPAGSVIDGTLELRESAQKISDANLFLLNPNGIDFKAGASLENIQGSLLASTAQDITFLDGYFSANLNSAPAQLSAKTPKYFKTGTNPRPINLARAGAQGKTSTILRTIPETSLLFIGGDVNFDNARLISEDTRVEVVSLSDNQTVEYIDLGLPHLKVPEGTTFSNINLLNESTIRVSSRNALATSLSQTAGIYLTGHHIFLKEESSLQSRTPVGSSMAFPISIQATNAQVLDTSFIYSTNRGNGKGASIRIDAQSFVLDCGGVIESCALVRSDSNGLGSAGDISFDTRQLQLLNGGQIYSVALASSSGDPGNIHIKSDNILFSGGFVLNDNWNGSGVILDNANNVQTDRSTDASILVETNRLDLQGGAFISSATFNANQAGNITVIANDIDIGGSATNPDGSLVPGTLNLPNAPIGSGIFATVEPGASGNGSILDVTTSSLYIHDGGRIRASTFGIGDAGLVTINANSVLIEGKDTEDRFPSSISAGSGLIPGVLGEDRSVVNAATGNGRNVNLTTRLLWVKDGGAIAVGSSNPDVEENIEAGNLNIFADSLLLENGGQLISDTASGDGGNINLLGYQDTEPMQALVLLDSAKISATAGLEDRGGDGGDIRINAESIFANVDSRLNAKGSDITANAYDGSGGNISIATDLLLGLQPGLSTIPNQLNDIDASSQLGTPGSINISANLVDPTSAVADLPTNPRIPKVARQCDRRVASASSRLIDSGKGGLAKSPVAYGQVPSSWEDLRLAAPHETLAALAPQTPPPTDAETAVAIEAQGLIRSQLGQLMLVSDVPQSPPSLQIASQPCSAPERRS